MPTKRLGISAITTAQSSMKPAPKTIAVWPARRAPSVFLAPAKRPTRTVAAKPMPSGTMKVTEPTFIAIWCAAIEAAPNVPMISVAALNSIASKIIDMPMGAPKRNISANFARSKRQKRCSKRYLRNDGAIRNTPSMAKNENA